MSNNNVVCRRLTILTIMSGGYCDRVKEHNNSLFLQRVGFVLGLIFDLQKKKYGIVTIRA